MWRVWSAGFNQGVLDVASITTDPATRAELTTGLLRAMDGGPSEDDSTEEGRARQRAAAAPAAAPDLVDQVVPNARNAQAQNQQQAAAAAAALGADRLELQAGARWLEDSLPFVVLLLLVFLQQHIFGIGAFCWLSTVLHNANARIRTQVLLKEQRDSLAVLSLASLLFSQMCMVVTRPSVERVGERRRARAWRRVCLSDRHGPQAFRSASIKRGLLRTAYCSGHRKTARERGDPQDGERMISYFRIQAARPEYDRTQRQIISDGWAEPETFARVGKHNRPVLIAHADDDAMLPSQMSERLASYFANSHVTTIKAGLGGHHFVRNRELLRPGGKLNEALDALLGKLDLADIASRKS